MISGSATTYIAAKKCLAHGIPFALCLRPGVEIDSTPEFYVENPQNGAGHQKLSAKEFESFDGFVVAPFKVGANQSIFGIRSELSAVELLNFIEDNPEIKNHEFLHIPYKTTKEDCHKESVRAVANSLKSDSEKTVLSRIHVENFDVNPIDASLEYFKKHTSCFRYIVSLPGVGVWFGATPELLLDYNRNDSELATMSLAGTRQVSNNGVWDKKNTLEHNIVTDYICDILSKHGLSIDEPRLTSVRFNEIEHMCHLITAHGDVAISDLLFDLSPTPAVCGWPRERAFNQIIETEKHQRLCYGGFVGATSPDYAHLFVNLRCAFADIQADGSAIYTLFAGGGITRHSEPDSEWRETELKMESLLSILRELNLNKVNK